MSLRDLQYEANEEMKRLFKGYKLKGEKGEPVNLQFFEDTAPIPKTDEDPSSVPYIVSRVSAGNIVEGDEFSTADVFFIIATFEDDESYSSNKDVLAVIQRITERFQKNTLLGNKYNKTGTMEFSLNDEDTYPYMFGGVKITFTLPKIVVEDDYC